MGVKERTKQLLILANVQGKKAEGNDAKAIKHNNEILNIKIIETLVLFLATIATTPISREIAVKIPEIWTIICMPAILAGLTVVQIVDLAIFYARFETSQTRIF